MKKSTQRKLLLPIKKLTGYLINQKVASASLQISIDQEIDNVKSTCKDLSPDNPICNGFKVYSQVDEDGIIEDIFNRIGEQSRIFCEIGASNGLENNSHYLLLKGWKGIWMEGSSELTTSIENSLRPADPSESSDLCIVNDYIKKGNVDNLISGAVVAAGFNLESNKTIDFLSIDIDGNDLEVLAAITEINARVICMEYNPKFPPPLSLSIAYNDSHMWNHDDYHGASLQALVDYLSEKGYTLVSCNVSGANAFFVRNEEVKGNFVEYPASALYQPARFHLTMKTSGHPPTLKFLNNIIKYCSL